MIPAIGAALGIGGMGDDEKEPGTIFNEMVRVLGETRPTANIILSGKRVDF